MSLDNASQTGPAGIRRPRPCDVCRKRKRRCNTQAGETICELCRTIGLPECTFTEPDADVVQQKRAAEERLERSHSKRPNVGLPATTPTSRVVEDYDSLRGPSLLKQNLGLQQHRHLRYIGPSDELDLQLFEFCPFDTKDESRFPDGSSIRKVSADAQFVLTPYARSTAREHEFEQLDAIERLVEPHGKRLVDLYFTYIHPQLPVLDKETFLEKYQRTHLEFSPPCLAGIYLLAVSYWNFDSELSSQKKPDLQALEDLGRQSLQTVIGRSKLSTLQGGLLLLHARPRGESTWVLSCQMVAIAQELGAHLDCSAWRIPTWEKQLRSRLGWATYMLDKWMSLGLGRPSHINDSDWMPTTIDENGATETSFPDLLALTRILSEILRLYYSPSAKQSQTLDPRSFLEAAKPVQIQLRDWHREIMSRNDHRLMTLELAYFAAEIALHRAILTFLCSRPCDAFIIGVCKNAARERIIRSMSLVQNIRMDQLQFWYFQSGNALISIGTLTSLLYVTSNTLAEAEDYKALLDRYRWVIRTLSGGSKHFEYAVQRLDASLRHLERLSPEAIVRGSHAHTPDAPEDSPTEATKVVRDKITSNTDFETQVRQDTSVDIPRPEIRVNSSEDISIINAGHRQSEDWLDITFPSPDSQEGMLALLGTTSTYDASQSMDFFGRDWNNGEQQGLNEANFWLWNRSLEDF